MNRMICKSLVLGALMALCTGAVAQEIVPRIQGHRGGRAEQDENTLVAFQNSYKAGIKSFETDMRLSKDGDLIVSHDASLERRCGINKNVEDMTAKELRKVKTLQGNPLLFLNDLLDFFKDKPDLYVEFEMKTSDYPDEVIADYCEKTYAAIKAKIPADADWVMTSFDYRPLRYLKVMHPDVTLQLITGSPCEAHTIGLAKTLGVQRLGAWLNGTSRRGIKEAHEAGLKVVLWPQKTIEDTLLSIYLGADYCSSDNPVEVKKFLNENMPFLKVK